MKLKDLERYIQSHEQAAKNYLGFAKRCYESAANLSEDEAKIRKRMGESKKVAVAVLKAVKYHILSGEPGKAKTLLTRWSKDEKVAAHLKLKDVVVLLSFLNTAIRVKLVRSRVNPSRDEKKIFSSTHKRERKQKWKARNR